MLNPFIAAMLADLMSDSDDPRFPEIDIDAVYPDDLHDAVLFAGFFQAQNGGDEHLFDLGLAWYGGIRPTEWGMQAQYLDELLDGNRIADIAEFGATIFKMKDALAGSYVAFCERGEAQARIDAVADMLGNMRGRTFGVDYLTLDGEPRTMLAQVSNLDIKNGRVTVREVNKTRASRNTVKRSLHESGIVDHDLAPRPADVLLTENEARKSTQYRTLYLDRIQRIRVAGESHEFAEV